MHITKATTQIQPQIVQAVPTLRDSALDWPEYQQTAAVQANGGQQEDTGKHVKDDDGGDELA